MGQVNFRMKDERLALIDRAAAGIYAKTKAWRPLALVAGFQCAPHGPVNAFDMDAGPAAKVPGH